DCSGQRKRRTPDQDALNAALIAGKTCSQCEAHKPHSDFYKNNYNRDGLSSKCRACASQAGSNRPVRKRTAAAQKRSWLWQKYKITLESYDAMLAAQGHSCAICKRPDEARSLVVDHN